MDEVDERALRQAREQLADDAHVASALLAAGDPAAERAALALAINAGSSAQGRRGAEEWARCFLSGFHLRDLSINKRPSGRSAACELRREPARYTRRHCPQHR